MAKLVLEAHDIEVAYGMRTVLSIGDFALYAGERVGLVGENGAGKSTFLKILSGELIPDAGWTCAYAPLSVIAQSGEGEDAEDGNVSRSFAAQPLRDGLSGGEKTRRRIAAALSGRVGVLLADEPTTDLDLDGLEKLEKALLKGPEALVLVSHDRALLDAVCTRIVLLEDGGITSFPGGYTAFLEEIENRRQYQAFRYTQYRAEEKRLRESMLKREEEAGRHTKLPSRMGNSEARLHKRETTVTQSKLRQSKTAIASRIEHLEKVERPRDLPEIAMRLGTPVPIVSRVACEIRDLTLTAGEKTLLSHAEARFPTGSRTVITGPNGCGKTTLLRALASGKDIPGIRIAPGVWVGWFDQDHAGTLEPEKTLLENVMARSIQPESMVRIILARLGIRGEAVHKKTAVLSGGEKAKCALARLFVDDIGFLLLDEPTNHLDIYTMEALEDVLDSWDGTLAVVSHDRRLIERTADRLLLFENGQLTAWEGTWQELTASRSRDEAAEREKLDRALDWLRTGNVPDIPAEEPPESEADSEALRDPEEDPEIGG